MSKRPTRRVWIAWDILCHSLARLADVAPPPMVVLSEDSDWLLVGGDLSHAIGSVTKPNE